MRPASIVMVTVLRKFFLVAVATPVMHSCQYFLFFSVQLKMTERTDQRICIKFCFNLGKSCTETIEMIQKAFVDESKGITQIKEWYKQFKNGRTSVDSGPRSGRPSLKTTPENIERVRLAIKGDRRLTVRELENDLGIPKTTVSEILNKILGMTRMCAKFIPKSLTTEQKDLRSEIAQDNVEIVSDDENVLKKVITGDESWVYGYDPEAKQQSSQWKHPDEPRPEKARQSRSHVKSMLIFFSIVRVLCTTNLLQEVRLSTKNITLKFLKDCVMP